jgi:ubiquinone/menaquinone biosynthesis C-methylase UbiE
LTTQIDFEHYRRAYDNIAKDDIVNEFEKAKYRRVIPFSRFITAKNTDKVLEVGVARGLLLNRLKGIKTGIDIAHEYIDTFRGDYVGICCSVESMPFPDHEFDVVIADSILEHVLDLNTCLKEVNRVLKPNGRFYALFPLDEDLSKYDWEIEKYGLREHQRTFHVPVELPFFKILRSEKILPVIPHQVDKYVTVSFVHRVTGKIFYLLSHKIKGFLEVHITLMGDYFLLHVLHYKSVSIMVEAVKDV